MAVAGVFDLELNEPGNDLGGNGERRDNNGEESSEDEHVQVWLLSTLIMFSYYHSVNPV